MLLGFMQKFPWKGEDKQPVPTNFREKILAGAGYLMSSQILAEEIKEKIGVVTHPGSVYAPKLHTFREDPYNRWKPGMSIQMVYRGPKYSILDHFNKEIPELEKCVSVQKIEIKWSKDSNPSLKLLSKTLGLESQNLVVLVDGRLVLEASISDGYAAMTGNYNNPGAGIVVNSQISSDLIIRNDGFTDIFQFIRWFKKDWKGKVIHWTDLRY